MQTIDFNTLFTDSLPGCRFEWEEIGVYLSIRQSVFTRLSLIHGKTIAGKIMQQVEDESEKVLPDKREYCINEFAYELRKHKEESESEIINQWAQSLCEIHDTDEVLNFISRLKENRESRKYK